VPQPVENFKGGKPFQTCLTSKNLRKSLKHW